MVGFTSKVLSNAVTRIYAPGGEQMYLVKGSDSAVLIDTGSGVGDLRAYVKTLTQLPVIVLLTHNHIDHAMGSAQFEHVYLSEADIASFDRANADPGRRCYLSDSPNYPLIEEQDYIPIDDPDRYHILKDGAVFDLGGLHIEAFLCPGHTAGSMLFLLREERTLIAGDAVSHFTMMQGSRSLGIRTYKKNIAAANARIRGLYDRIYLSHDEMVPPLDMMERVMEVCRQVQAGTDDKIPFRYMGGCGLIAKACGSVESPYGCSPQNRLDGGFGNFVYDPKRIWE